MYQRSLGVDRENLDFNSVLLEKSDNPPAPPAPQTSPLCPEAVCGTPEPCPPPMTGTYMKNSCSTDAFSCDSFNPDGGCYGKVKCCNGACEEGNPLKERYVDFACTGQCYQACSCANDSQSSQSCLGGGSGSGCPADDQPGCDAAQAATCKQC